MNLKIYAATHKKVFFPKSNFIIPLHVGKEGKEDFGYIGDNTGDNISSKNKNYCELTGVYWIWKNDTDSDYIGLCHYRRYFLKSNLVNDIKYALGAYTRKIKGAFLKKRKWKERKISIKKHVKINKLISITDKYLEKEISNLDIIVLKKFNMDKNLKELYSSALNKSDLDILRDVIEKKHNEYLSEFDEFLNKKDISPCNMFVFKREIFKKYCTWLFDILFEVEKKVEISTDAYKARVFGFMGEYLLNVYINYHSEYKINKMDMLYIKE